MMLSLNNIDDFATYEGSANYITTDSMGNAVLDLSTNIASLTVMTNGFSHIQLGTLLLGGGGWAPYSIYFDANTNGAIIGTFTVEGAVVPIPSALWLFGSGLLGLVGIARRKKSA